MRSMQRQSEPVRGKLERLRVAEKSLVEHPFSRGKGDKSVGVTACADEA